MTQCGVAEQGVDRGEPVVAGADMVSAVAFEMLQERGHQRRVEVVNIQRVGLFAGAGSGEGEQEPERVAVGGDGVWARAALADEPVGEEGLQYRRQGTHRRPPNRSSRRVAASCISSGTAVRYQ